MWMLGPVGCREVGEEWVYVLHIRNICQAEVRGHEAGGDCESVCV